MIKFITNREDHNVSVPRSTIQECMDYLDKLELIGIDTENSSLVPHHCIPLLLQLGDDNDTFVIDVTSVDISWLEKYKDKKFIGQNLKYDYSVLKAQFGIEIRNLVDLMIVEQTLGMGSGRKNSLDAIIERRLNKQATFAKTTRNEFINGRKSFIFEDRHVIYAGDDIQYLHPIWNIQQELIKKFEMEFVLHEIEFKLIPILGDCELEGIKLNVEKWKENIISNKKQQYQTLIKLDEEVMKLAYDGDIAESNIKNEKLIGGKFTRKRNTPVETIQTGLFGIDKVIKPKNDANINYGSPEQVKEIFRRVGEPLPTDKYGKDTIGVEHLKKYIVDFPQTKLFSLVENLIKYSEVTSKIENFGQGHIDIISLKTGKIHTIYRQCTTTTGRFQSGDRRSGTPFFNSQNIPKYNEYRHCFYTDEGYKMLTIDLASAELIVLASLARDNRLFELQAQDIHGYLASASYNNMMMELRRSILSRDQGIMDHHILEVASLLTTTKEVVSYDQAKIILENFLEGEAIVINKEKFKWIRDNFKRIVYGVAYGATTMKIAEVLGIPKSWAEIVYKTMRKELPATFKYLDTVAKDAVNNAYTIISERTNSRRWFPEILEAKRNKLPVSFSMRNEVEREAKNAGIQGTNAFIIKEAIVRIENEYIKPNKLDAKLLMQVHDELVYKFHESLESTFPNKVKEILEDTALRYLNGISMGSASHIGLTWHK